MRPAVTRSLLLSLTAALAATGAHAETGTQSAAGRGRVTSVAPQTLTEAEAALTRLEADEGALGNRERATRARLTRRIHALYRLTRPGAAPLGAGFDAVREHLARVRHLERLTKLDANALAAFDDERARLADEGDRLRDRVGALRVQARAHATMGADSDPLVHPADAGGDRDAPFYGVRIVEGPPLDSFEDRRGELASPVRGEVRLIDVGDARSGNAALEMQTPAGAPVMAAAAGRVAYTSHEPGDGDVVILDHGDGFSTVYSGLGSVEVQRGDSLSERARLGSVGSAQHPPALRFEVRHRGRALPPREWLGF